jgi:O-antigen biosynthesis protein
MTSDEFDAEDYLSRYPEVRALAMSPQEHFVRFGARLGYTQSSLKENISLQYLTEFDASPQILEGSTSSAAEVYKKSLEIAHNVLDLDFKGEDCIPAEPPVFDVRSIAFYLPQFHPIPENDRWWGKGFTEWTNVSKAVPQYVGHYQPHLAGELGYYDLRVEEVQKRQSELAKSFGLSAFCFYFYWFGGQTLLERPITSWADNDEADLPFCLCWANENWSRRWDGLDEDVLMAQSHSIADDIAFISHISKYLENKKYLKIGEKPLLIVYRPSLLPDPKTTVDRWRHWCRENGIGEIHVSVVQSFDMMNPLEIGFDSAIEFPPMNMGPPDITQQISKINPSFSGTVYDYDFYVDRSNSFPARDYTVYRGVFPSWDNEARRTGKGTSFLGSSPAKFKTFVENAVREARREADPQKRLIFINAWNEWAEGAHLEPDRRYGYAWLSALHDGLKLENARNSVRRLALVVHDGYRHGAQYLALNMARVFSRDLGFDLSIIILGDGPLKQEFEKYGQVYDLAGIDPRSKIALNLAKKLHTQGTKHAICNTSVTGLFLETLCKSGIECISLIHELPNVIAEYKLEGHLKAIWKHAKYTVYPSKYVKESMAHPETSPTITRTQGLYKHNKSSDLSQIDAARTRLRTHFGLNAATDVVLAVAYGDKRKGVDLWADIGRLVAASRPDTVFIWVGEIQGTELEVLNAKIRDYGLEGKFIFPGFQTQTDDFYAGADIYALPSREDPFPSVIMEALQVGIPIVAFEGAGGFDGLLQKGVGELVEMEDCESFANAIVGLLSDKSKRENISSIGRDLIKSDYSFRKYCFDLAYYLGADLKRVSVVVPNYNYAMHLPARLNSILNQGYPLYELIVLDDCSNDDSLNVARNWLKSAPVDWQLVPNQTNSGSPFKQWLKGAQTASGDFLWIAEADDLTLHGFLDTNLGAFENPNVVMGYCQSQQMAGDGTILCADYLEYVSDISATKWLENYFVEGKEEIRSVLAIKNTIPNVSSVVFHRDTLVSELEKNIDYISSFRVAGDWATYVKVLDKGALAFSPEPLNLHRRHQGSITLGSFNEKQLHEILAVQKQIRIDYGLPKDVEQSANAYAQSLYKQFGIDSESWPFIFDNPVFRDYFYNEGDA